MGFESFSQEPSQEQLAQEYLATHAEYTKIQKKALGMYDFANSMEKEAAPQNMVDQQRVGAKAVSEEADVVMKKYVAIGEKLTSETKDKYLR